MHHVQKKFKKVRVRMLPSQKYRPQRAHDQILGDKIQKGGVENQSIYNMIDNED